jgi:DNA-binding transcriptional regulator YhcF (GntR family)
MKPRPLFMENPDKYEIATEVLSSAIKVLQASGFYETEILQLFDQVAKKRERAPLYLEPLSS